jgi:hypothetical protein
MDNRFHSRIEASDWALGFGEPAGKLDLERGDLVANMSDPGDDVARQQTNGEFVGVTEDDHVLDPEAER